VSYRLGVPSTFFAGGTVWTGVNGQTTDALLVVDGAVQSVGEQARSQAAGAVHVDLGGGFLMPSFGDGHAHPLPGGLEAVGPQVRRCKSVDEIVDEVGRFAAEHPDDEWIVGASYDSSLAPDGLFDARWLDAAVPDRPVVLRAWDYHTVWCNTVALERAGITADTPDPLLGTIPRRADGSVLGTLREWGAVDLVHNVVPERDPKVRVDALRTAADYYLARGVTWVQDAWVEPGDVDTYLDAARQDKLAVRFNLGLYADPRYFDSQLEHFADARRRVQDIASPLLTANTVKFFADGVIENETGALLAPYCGSLHQHGMQVWENLADAARAVDALGFQIHIHAIGDAAARQALDAIEHVVATNGPRDRRPVIAHAQLVDDVDIARFAALGVIPNMQPLWAQLDPLMVELTIPRLGADRGALQYRIRSLDDSGAPLAFGSDWPVSSGTPLKGIAVAVSRGGWTPHEIMSVERAMSAYTAGVARQAFAERQWGTITPGSDADLVWLDRDPRSIPAADLGAVRVVGTYLRGDRVYSVTGGDWVRLSGETC
jgi:predicted amidohydrolase YtcJ